MASDFFFTSTLIHHKLVWVLENRGGAHAPDFLRVRAYPALKALNNFRQRLNFCTAQAAEERARLTSPEELARTNLSRIVRKLSRETVVSLSSL